MSSPLFAGNGGLTRFAVEYLSAGEAGICSKLVPSSQILQNLGKDVSENDQLIACAKLGWTAWLVRTRCHHDYDIWNPESLRAQDVTEITMIQMAMKNAHFHTSLFIFNETGLGKPFCLQYGFATMIRAIYRRALNPSEIMHTVSYGNICAIREAKKLSKGSNLMRFYQLVQHHAIRYEKRKIERLANKWIKKHRIA